MGSGLMSALKFVGGVIMNIVLFPFVWIHLRILDWKFAKKRKEKLAESAKQ